MAAAWTETRQANGDYSSITYSDTTDLVVSVLGASPNDTVTPNLYVGDSDRLVFITFAATAGGSAVSVSDVIELVPQFSMDGVNWSETVTTSEVIVAPGFDAAMLEGKLGYSDYNANYVRFRHVGNTISDIIHLEVYKKYFGKDSRRFR